MPTTKLFKATFGAGCFWGVEGAFRGIPGVVDAACGYEGGAKQNPTYEDVCTGETGHAEVVEVNYDPVKVSYGELVKAFFKMHDPTTLNSQGPDIGTQYRSAIFTHNEEQKAEATKIMKELEASQVFKNTISTTIEPAQTFTRAEESHQRYFEKHPERCRITKS